MNPIEFIKAIRNPKQYVMNYAKQNNNPMFNNLIDMANKGDTKGLEEFARNIYKEQGKDFDNDFNTFKSMMNK